MPPSRLQGELGDGGVGDGFEGGADAGDLFAVTFFDGVDVAVEGDVDLAVEGGDDVGEPVPEWVRR